MPPAAGGAANTAGVSVLEPLAWQPRSHKMTALEAVTPPSDTVPSRLHTEVSPR